MKKFSKIKILFILLSTLYLNMAYGSQPVDYNIETSIIEYKQIDSISLSMMVITPEQINKNHKRAAIVLIHGGGWYNEIGGSQVLADILVILSRGNESLSPTLFNELCVTLSKSGDPKKWTGANKLDIARHHLYRGCLLGNDSIVKSSAEEIFYPVFITKEEGIQEDMSYQQHGAQLYIGGYGIVFAFGISEIAYMLAETPYALSEEKKAVFSRFMRDGFFKVFRGSYIDWSVTGRGISRMNIVVNKDLISVIDRMMHIDSDNIKYYKQAKTRFLNDNKVDLGIKSENIMYYRSDYMVHNTPSYQATVRSASVRCMKAENGNGENLKSPFLSDGAFNVRQTGDEYLNIFPLWEWDKIPGVTSPKQLVTIAGSWRTPGTSKLTGGVSDGSIGAFAYKHNDHGFHAYKGWFLWDDMIVALGAGISSDSMALQTTLDQTYLRSEIKIKQDKQNQRSVKTISETLDTPEYIIHNKMAYIPIQSGKLTLKAGIQKENWLDINYNQINKVIEGSVFNLVWEHPQGDSNASYGYIQIPNCTSSKKIEAARNSISVINTSSLQSVYRKDENKAMALFYQEGSYTVGRWAVSVDRPSLLLLKGIDKDSLEIVAVNLKGDSNPIEITINNTKNNISKTIRTNSIEMRPDTIIIK